jgi:caa(3)-type oxidase subunit IV
MNAPSHAPGHGAHGHSHEAHYVRIWAILVALLLVSYFGPMVAMKFGWHWLLLTTAFGVAVIKAYMVAKNFMHINVEQPIIHFMMITGVALMVLLYGAVSPDIQRGAGQHWQKDAGFHHSFTTSKPHHAGGHEEAAPSHEEGAPAETPPAEDGATPATGEGGGH